jgi:cytochrome c
VKAVAALLALLLMGFAAAAQPAGERVFQKCFACHSVVAGETDLPGPTLAGVVGRPAAAQPGFDYSDAMRRAAEAGLVWTPEALDRFLADPFAALRGTTMGFVGLRDAAERRAVIEYLAALP